MFRCPDCNEERWLNFNGREEDEEGNKSGVLNFDCGTCKLIFKMDHKGRVLEKDGKKNKQATLSEICLE